MRNLKRKCYSREIYASHACHMARTAKGNASARAAGAASTCKVLKTEFRSLPAKAVPRTRAPAVVKCLRAMLAWFEGALRPLMALHYLTSAM